jgi:hypothetical protein
MATGATWRPFKTKRRPLPVLHWPVDLGARNLIPQTGRSNRNSKELKLNVTPRKETAEKFLIAIASRGKAKVQSCSALTAFLIEWLAIRNAPKFSALNKTLNSNRQKKGIF